MKRTICLLGLVVSLGAFAGADARLERVNGVPCVTVNGEVLPPMSFTAWMAPQLSDEYLRRVDAAGIRIHYVYSWTRGLKPGDPEKSELDGVEETVRRIRQIRRNCPHAYVIIRLMVSPSADWIAEHPEECVRFSDGSPEHCICTTVDRRRKVDMYSMCSEKWWAWADAQIEDFYRELSKHPGFEHVIGTFLCSGGTCEWYYPLIFRRPKGRTTGDFSEPFRRQYERFLREKYGTVEALRRAWNRPDATFEKPVIPAFEDFAYIGDPDGTTYGDFLDADRRAWTADFFLALHDGTARAIVHFAETLKRVQPKLLVGAFYGSYAQTTMHDGGTATGLLRILDSPAVDFLAAPGGYNNREPGGLVIGREMQDAYLLRGKIFISEDDDRTFLTWRSKAVKPEDDPVTGSGPEGTFNMLKRDFGRNICELTRGWWFDMGTRQRGFFYDDRRITDLWRRQQEIAKEAYALGNVKANDIAIVVDAESTQYTSALVSRDVLDFWRMTDLHRIGAPVDYHFSADLLHPAMRDYKLYVMMNAYALDPKRRAAVYEKAARNGATVLWMYAPGLIDMTAEKKLDVAHIAETTGMGVRRLEGLRSPAVTVGDRTYGLTGSEIHNADEIHCVEFGTKTICKPQEKLNPAFAIDDPKAEVIGRYAEGGEVAIAAVTTNGVRSVYATPATLNREILAKIAREAGCHIYADDGDVLYANENYVVLHASRAGRKTIRLRRKCSPWEVYERKPYGTDTDVIEADMAFGETKMWQLKR